MNRSMSHECLPSHQKGTGRAWKDRVSSKKGLRLLAPEQQWVEVPEAQERADHRHTGTFKPMSRSPAHALSPDPVLRD